MDTYDSFGEMELAGWSEANRAAAYVELFASASDQAIPALLSAVDAKPGMRVLDLCSGQGNISEVLVAAGCEVVGADFSPAMVALAEARVPSATFIEADAQDLPLDDGEFDAVVSGLGICHVPDQPRALSEVHRVLGKQCRFSMTVWYGPEVSPAFATLYGAVKAHGDPDVKVPDGPDFHQFGRSDVAQKLLSEAGFTGIEISKIDSYWDLSSPDGLAEIYENATVRAAALLTGQPARNLAAIRDEMAKTVRSQFSHGDGWRVPVPAALVAATSI